METVKDIKRMIRTLKDDIKHKETRIKELEAQGNTMQAKLLQAEVKGMKDVIQDIEQVIY